MANLKQSKQHTCSRCRCISTLCQLELADRDTVSVPGWPCHMVLLDIRLQLVKQLLQRFDPLHMLRILAAKFCQHLQAAGAAC